MKEKLKIVIADDNLDFANTLKNYLSKEEDMEIVGMGKDGEEACKIISEQKPDIVLLDVIMPHLDG